MFCKGQKQEFLLCNTVNRKRNKFKISHLHCLHKLRDIADILCTVFMTIHWEGTTLVNWSYLYQVYVTKTNFWIVRPFSYSINSIRGVWIQLVVLLRHTHGEFELIGKNQLRWMRHMNSINKSIEKSYMQCEHHANSGVCVCLFNYPNRVCVYLWPK